VRDPENSSKVDHARCFHNALSAKRLRLVAELRDHMNKERKARFTECAACVAEVIVAELLRRHGAIVRDSEKCGARLQRAPH